MPKFKCSTFYFFVLIFWINWTFIIQIMDKFNLLPSEVAHTRTCTWCMDTWKIHLLLEKIEGLHSGWKLLKKSHFQKISTFVPQNHNHFFWHEIQNKLKKNENEIFWWFSTTVGLSWPPLSLSRSFHSEERVLISK